MSEHLTKVIAAIIDGDADAAAESAQTALAASVDPLLILNEGLMRGADEVGKRFEHGEYFLSPSNYLPTPNMTSVGPRSARESSHR